MTLCELFLLTESYFWLSSGLGLRLEVRWLQERVGNTIRTKHFWIWKKLRKATVSDGSVALLGFELFLNEYVKIENSCRTISRQILKYSDIGVIKGICKG